MAGAGGQADGARARKAHQLLSRQRALVGLVNTFFFLFAGFASLWMILLAMLDTRGVQWFLSLYLVLLWATMACVFLPRLFKLATAIFIPDYFIGRARTDTGILGDVVNMAWDGPEDNIHRLMQDAGWVLSEPVTLKSTLKIMRSVVLRKPYPDAPVSPLFLFGRKQDFAYQMAVGKSASQRHHIRFWKCPEDWPLPGGKTVDWLAAAAFDQGVRLSGFTFQVTHSISGDIDKERDFTISSVKSVDPTLKIAWITKFSTAFHARNGGGDMVHTDGNLPIVEAEKIPESIRPAVLPQKRKKKDPEKAKTIWEFLKRTPRPPSLYFTVFVVVIGILVGWHSLFTGNYFSALGMWILLALTMIAPIALFFGRSWAREAMMLAYGANVLVYLVAWVMRDFKVDSQTGLLHIGLAILMLLTLSSDSVTQYTMEITRWRKEHSRLRTKLRERHSGRATS